jgi:4-amino-4-deoxy-L-arabinose transferase-like glycosyltransferase
MASVSAVVGRRGLRAWYGLATVLAVFTYFYGLDSQHIPKNGDEYPYEHITRVTASSGHWLPLRSEIKEMRNTKPPLLFWQGITSTGWSAEWTLWNLRWPSVMYTLATAALVFVLGWSLSRQLETGFVAALTFVAFFSTYRYGRPFLTDSPSVFWLFIPCFALLYWRSTITESRLIAPALLGVATGIGLLYKSFALVLPVAVFLMWWFLRERRYHVGAFIARDAGKLVILCAVALAVFGVWFVLDPDPGAIVREFIFEENAGKFDAPGGYLPNLLWGSSSIWRLVVSYPINAGLLMFPVIALFAVAFKRRAAMDDGERLLWMWVITLFVVFSLPSQRDERYLLPAMPAVAVLCALNWDRIPSLAFKATLLITGIGAAALAYLSWRLEENVPGDPLYSFDYWVLLGATLTVITVPLVVPRLARACVHVAVLLAFATFAASLHPFDDARGTFGADAQRVVKGREVWVPINFVAREEGHRFLLPGAEVRGYPLERGQTVKELASRFPVFSIRVPMNATDTSGGTVIGERLDIATRHTNEQLLDMVRGNVFEHLFVRELLVEAEPHHEPATSGDETSR